MNDKQKLIIAIIRFVAACIFLSVCLLLFLGQVNAAPQQAVLETAQNVRLRVPPVGRWVNNYALAANTARQITVPGWANYVNISPGTIGATIWVNWTTAISAVPTGDTTDGSGSVANSGVRYIGPTGAIDPAPAVAAINTFWVISGTSQEISVECWR